MVYTNRKWVAMEAYDRLSSGVQEQLCKWAKEFGYEFESGDNYYRTKNSREKVLQMICPCAYTEYPRRDKQTQASMESYNSEALGSRSADVFFLLKDQIVRYELKLANMLRKNKFEETSQGTFICNSQALRLKYTAKWLQYTKAVVASNGSLEIKQTRSKKISANVFLFTYLVKLDSISKMSNDHRTIFLKVNTATKRVLDHSCSCEHSLATLQPCKHSILVMAKEKFELENPPKHICTEHYLRCCQVYRIII